MGVVVDLSWNSAGNTAFIVAEPCLHSIEAFSAAHLNNYGMGWVSTRNREATQVGQLTLADLRNISGYMIPCSAHSAGGRRKWVISGEMVFVIPSHCYMWWSPAFLEMAEHLPAGGKWQIDFLFCFVCVNYFSFTYWTVFISTMSFFPFLIPSSIPLWGSEQAAVWGWVARWG